MGGKRAPSERESKHNRIIKDMSVMLHHAAYNLHAACGMCVDDFREMAVALCPHPRPLWLAHSVVLCPLYLCWI